MFDGKAFGQEIVAAVKQHVSRELAPLIARLDALDARMGSLPAPKEYNPEASARLVIGETVLPRMKAIEDGLSDVDAAVAPLLKRIEELEAREPLKGEDGKSITLEDVAPFINEEIGNLAHDLQRMIPREVETAMSNLPKPENGKDADPADIERAVAAAVAAIPPAQPGKDADPDEMRREIAEQVKAAVGALPVPKNGDSVTVDDVRPVIEEQVSKAVAAIPIPKDGKDGRDGLNAVKFIRDAGGNLIAVMSNGTTCDLGGIQGKDGAPGRDGLNGKDGLDGIGFDDMDFEIREDGCYIVFIKGEVQKEARLPIPIDRGVYKEGQTYRKGDGVTWGGSFWFAQEETTEKPDSGKGWRLAVKKGRDSNPQKPVKV